MKKITSLFLLITIICTFSGCNSTSENDSKLQIVTTIFPYYSFAKEICGENADIKMLLKPGAESHSFDPTAQDIMNIKNSDIFIYTGGESDNWADTILSSIDTNKTKIIKAIDVIEPIKTEHNHIKTTDEHIWTSIKNTVKIADVIYNAIDNQEFLGNKNNFINRLNQLDTDFQNAVKSAEKTLIFADRFPFSYFANDYNLKYISAFSNCSEDAEPSVQTIAEIINIIKEENISNIFYIEFSNQKIADTIQRETEVKKLLFHSCHNVTAEDFNSGISYLKLMESNLNNLKEAVR